MNLKIAIVSDLHCHNKTANNNVIESYLLTDNPSSTPINQDPFASFKKLIEKNDDIKADILIMPGDLTNRCDQDGYDFGWNITKEIGKLLNANCVLPTIGNHDVDSRKKFSLDPFEKIRSFSTDFPFISAAENKLFWKNGFLFFEGDRFRVLVINSAHNHTTVAEAEHGFISQETLNDIEEALKNAENDPKQFNLAICHHHPIPHERHYLGSKDLMYNGTQLVELLGQFNYQILIHGHKHDPLIRYAPGGSTSPVVFSSGSFSAFKTLLLQGAYNTFHLLTLEDIVKEDCENQGTVKTWFFTPSKGWELDVNNEYFLPRIGFGCRTSLTQLASKVNTWFLDEIKSNFSWNEFIVNFPMIEYLLPSDKKKLGEKLKTFGINVYPNFPFEPEIISFNRP